MAYIKRNTTNTKILLEEEKNDLSTQENDENIEVECIKPEDLISYISMWDFSKVQLAIKSQIKIDQDNYNNDIIKSLNNLETAIKIYSNANNNLIKILSTVNDLLAYTKGKDYYIKWFNNVEFDLNKYNTTEIKTKLLFLQDIIGKNETISLIKQINSVVNKNNTNVINREDSPFLSPTTSSDYKEIKTNDSSFSIKDNFSETETKELVVDEIKIVVDEIEVQDDITKNDISSFDITENFSKENEEIENLNPQDEQSNNEKKVFKFDIKDNFSETETEELVIDEIETWNNNFWELDDNNNNISSFDITKNFSKETGELENIKQDEQSGNETKVFKFDIKDNFSETETEELVIDEIETWNNNFWELDDNNNEKDHDHISSNNHNLIEIKIKNVDNIENIWVNNTSDDTNSKKINISNLYESLADYNFEDEEDNNIDKNININTNEERVETFKVVI